MATSAAVAAVALPTPLVERLVALGLSRRAVRAAGRLTVRPPLTGRTRGGGPPAETLSAFAARPVEPVGWQPSIVRTVRARTAPNGAVLMSRLMADNEPVMRARYLVAASSRLTTAQIDGRFTAAATLELTYLDAHRRAGIRRARIARDYDALARRHEFLSWLTRNDARVTPDCRARSGETWHISAPPFPPPGAQHVACRCISVPIGSPRLSPFI